MRRLSANYLAFGRAVTSLYLLPLLDPKLATWGRGGTQINLWITTPLGRKVGAKAGRSASSAALNCAGGLAPGAGMTLGDFFFTFP